MYTAMLLKGKVEEILKRETEKVFGIMEVEQVRVF